MTTLAEIQAKIEALHEEARQIRAKNFEDTLSKIRALMSENQITLGDVQRHFGVNGKRSDTKVKAPAKAKYRGPNGETWSGRGLMPRWLTALAEAGRTKEEFFISDTHQ